MCPMEVSQEDSRDIIAGKLTELFLPTDSMIRHFASEDEATQPSWDEEFRKSSDGKGGGLPRYPEGFLLNSSWRRERRANSKLLRREELGY